MISDVFANTGLNVFRTDSNCIFGCRALGIGYWTLNTDPLLIFPSYRPFSPHIHNQPHFIPLRKNVSCHKINLLKEVFPMAETGEIYRCEVCGMVVEVKEAGGGELVCCDQPMVKEN